MRTNVELDDRVIEPQLHSRVECMDDDVRSPVPAFERVAAMLSDEPISLNAASSVIVTSKKQAPGQGAATDVAICEPDLEAGQKPERVMGNVELTPSRAW